MKRLHVLTIVVFAALLAGCWGPPKVSDVDIQQITLERYDELRGDEKLTMVVIDVRRPEQYAAGHLPGAINIPLPQLAEADPRLAVAGVIVVYAGGWTDPLSPAAAKRLTALRYQNVYDLRGGVEVWESASRPLRRQDSPSTEQQDGR